MASSEGLKLDELPEDVLVIILSHLEIWDIFSARLVSQTLHAVIGSSIRSISRHICLNTFPNDRQLARKPANGSGECDFDWLRDRIPRKLASVLLDHGERPIPAEADWGEVARYRVTRGWKVLKQISRAYQEAYQMDEDTALRLQQQETRADADEPGKIEKTKPGIKWSKYTGKLLRKDAILVEAREALALKKCHQVVSTLRRCDALGFMLLWDRLVCGPFRLYFGPYDTLHEDCVGRRHCICPSYCGRRASGVNMTGENAITLERGNCWTTWFILHNGPCIFFRQWYSRESKHMISDVLLETWRGRSKRRIEVERSTAAMVWAAVWMRAWSQKVKKGGMGNFFPSESASGTSHSRSESNSSSGNSNLKAMESSFNPSRILRPEYLWWDDSISQGGLGSSAMPWLSFMFEEQPMWQELYDDWGSLPIRGQVLWLLWQQGRINLDDEDFDVEEMLATTEDVDDLLDAYWHWRIGLRGCGGWTYSAGNWWSRRAYFYKRDSRLNRHIKKLVIKLYEWAVLPRRLSILR